MATVVIESTQSLNATTHENRSHEGLFPREKFHDFAASYQLVGVPNAHVRLRGCAASQISESTREIYLCAQNKNTGYEVVNSQPVLRWRTCRGMKTASTAMPTKALQPA